MEVKKKHTKERRADSTPKNYIEFAKTSRVLTGAVFVNDSIGTKVERIKGGYTLYIKDRVVKLNEPLKAKVNWFLKTGKYNLL